MNQFQKMGKRVAVIFLTSMVFLGIVSCDGEEKNIIAIDVLLTPSEKMTEQAIYLNKLMMQNNPASFHLDTLSIPHITLVQCFVHESDLPKIENELQGLYQYIKEDTLRAKRLVYSPDQEESFATIQIQKSKLLLFLHEEAIKRLKPYMLVQGSSKAFVPNTDGTPIDSFTLSYVPKFVEKYSHENFQPHISLGVAQVDFLEMLAQRVFSPLEFQASSLAIYQMGDSGTAKKQLWKSRK